MPTEDNCTNTLHRFLDTSTTATKLMVIMHCVGILVVLHCLHYNCCCVNLEKCCYMCRNILCLYNILVAHKHKIDTMTIKHTRNLHSNQYRWWCTVGVRHTLHKNMQSIRDKHDYKSISNCKQLHYLRQYKNRLHHARPECIAPHFKIYAQITLYI